MPSLEVEAMVRGYHVYQDIWDAVIHEELVCVSDPDNLWDPFAVAVVKYWKRAILPCHCRRTV